MRLKGSAKWWPFCLSLNVLIMDASICDWEALPFQIPFYNDMLLVTVVDVLFVVAVMASSDRKLRPMIQAKQLDLPQSINDFSYASMATPRTNLAKELEKYNRPQVDFQANKNIVPKLKDMSSNPVPTPTNPGGPGPDRPNILSRRPHYKPQYRYDPQGPMNLSMKSEEGGMETLDLSMKKVGDFEGSEGQQRPSVLMTSRGGQLQEEPMDFSTKQSPPPAILGAGQSPSGAGMSGMGQDHSGLPVSSPGPTPSIQPAVAAPQPSQAISRASSSQGSSPVAALASQAESPASSEPCTMSPRPQQRASPGGGTMQLPLQLPPHPPPQTPPACSPVTPPAPPPATPPVHSSPTPPIRPAISSPTPALRPAMTPPAVHISPSPVIRPSLTPPANPTPSSPIRTPLVQPILSPPASSMADSPAPTSAALPQSLPQPAIPTPQLQPFMQLQTPVMQLQPLELGAPAPVQQIQVALIQPQPLQMQPLPQASLPQASLTQPALSIPQPTHYSLAHTFSSPMVSSQPQMSPALPQMSCGQQFSMAPPIMSMPQPAFSHPQPPATPHNVPPPGHPPPMGPPHHTQTLPASLPPAPNVPSSQPSSASGHHHAPPPPLTSPTHHEPPCGLPPGSETKPRPDYSHLPPEPPLHNGDYNSPPGSPAGSRPNRWLSSPLGSRAFCVCPLHAGKWGDQGKHCHGGILQLGVDLRYKIFDFIYLRYFILFYY